MNHKKKSLYLLVFLLLLPFITTGCKNKKDLFLEALRINDFDTAKDLLEETPDLINARLDSGGSLLHAAVFYDNKRMLDFLINHGANINDKGKNNETPLHSAAIQSRIEIASSLLEDGANINARDELQCTPLHKAAMYSNKAMVDLLISHGAEINAKRDYCDRTPLFYACVNRDEDKDALEVVKTLLMHGANPNAKCSPDSSMIQLTLVYPDCYFEKAQLLEDFGATFKLETDDRPQVTTVKDFRIICEENKEYIQKFYNKPSKRH
ncbi:MAG: ankyrin repeat domain-containing protein [Planctomycetota bacterium]|jgi:cytohesin